MIVIPHLFHEIQKNNLYFNELFEDEMVLLVRRGHPMSAQSRVRLAEMSNYSCVSFNTIFAPNTMKIFKKYGYNQTTISINDWDSIRRMLVSMDCFTPVPCQIVEEKFNAYGDFKTIEVADFEWKCKVGLIQKSPLLSEIEEIFIDYLKKEWKIC